MPYAAWQTTTTTATWRKEASSSSSSSSAPLSSLPSTIELYPPSRTRSSSSFSSSSASPSPEIAHNPLADSILPPSSLPSPAPSATSTTTTDPLNAILNILIRLIALIARPAVACLLSIYYTVDRIRPHLTLRVTDAPARARNDTGPSPSSDDVVHGENGPRRARDELSYNVGFSLLKDFLELTTSHTVRSLQRFVDIPRYLPLSTFTPSVHTESVIIPSSSLADGAEKLRSWFGTEEQVRNVLGGREWWTAQPREDGGIEGEWIWDKEGWRSDRKEAKWRGWEGGETEDMGMTMLFFHGGGAYFGSIETHRLIITKYVTMSKTRALAINYRLAPQYPFPCAVHDCLSSYLYLINPPPGASHSPVPPSRIVIAGDSAGGNLALTVLCILRDLSLPLPSAGILLSPWVDMTHSFPSVMENTGTDILPPYGFMHKPSLLWPPKGFSPFIPEEKMPDSSESDSDGGSDSSSGEETVPGTNLVRTKGPEEAARVAGTDREILDDGATNKLVNGVEGQVPASPVPLDDAHSRSRSKSNGSILPPITTATIPTSSLPAQLQNESTIKLLSTEQPLLDGPSATSIAPALHVTRRTAATRATPFLPPTFGPSITTRDDGRIVVMLHDGNELELNSQIQLHVTNEQLCHPMVSPLVTPSLGGLPELFIMASDAEVLRDEILYVAHRASNPQKYPIRRELLEANPVRAKQADGYGPTSVHLQVYDDTCHMLPVLAFTEPAKHSYDAVAAFTQRVAARVLPPTAYAKYVASFGVSPDPSSSDLTNNGIDREPSESSAKKIVPAPRPTPNLGFPKHPYFTRERIATDGTIRPLEPAEELKAMQHGPDSIVTLREAPVRRYLEGKAIWDERFGKQRRRIDRKRKAVIKREEEKRARLIEDGGIVELPWEGGREKIPPSALAGRMDVRAARKLAKVCRARAAAEQGLQGAITPAFEADSEVNDEQVDAAQRKDEPVSKAAAR